MVDAVIFNGINALDFHDIRSNTVRIPEVIKRLQEAQRILDHENDQISLDLLNFMCSDDEIYLKSIKLKSLCATIAQIGLYDRYIKNFQLPAYLAGNIGGESALRVCAGELAFADMIKNSDVCHNWHPQRALSVAGEPMRLSGIALTTYSVYEKSQGQPELYERLPIEEMDIEALVTAMVEEQSVRKFINIGPGNILLSGLYQKFALSDIQFLESIDLDPMLSWYWPTVGRASAIGQ